MSAFVALLLLTAGDAPDYARDVQPILTAHCAGCHNADDAANGFRADAFAHVIEPVDDEFALVNGPTLLPGRGAESRIVRLMTGEDQPRMPPEDDADAVSPEEIAVVRAWIDAGALNSAEELPRSLNVPSLPPASSDGGITSLAAAGDVIYEGRFGRVSARRGDNVLWTFDDVPGKVNDLTVTADAKFVLAASGVGGLRGEVVVLSVTDGSEVQRITGHDDTLYAVAAAGDVVATAGYDRTIRLWSLRSGELVAEMPGHNGAVFDLAFSPDGTLLASASADETVKLWNVATATRVDTFSQPEGEVTAVAFSGEGRSVVAGSADNRVRRWSLGGTADRPDNRLELTRFVHEESVTALDVTGELLVTASSDGTVKFWDAADVSLVEVWPGQPDVVSTLAVVEDSVLVGRLDGSTESRPLPAVRGSAVADSRDVATTFVEDRAQTAGEESEPNGDIAAAQPLSIPASVTAAIGSPGDVDFYAFDAKAGEQWVIETSAARPSLGDAAAPTDTVIEVLTESGERIERVRLQAVRDSYFTFRGKNSTQTDDFRVFNWREMELGDMLYAGGEVSRLWLYPNGPDAGFYMFPGQGLGNRQTLYDTTAVSHALGEPAYVVRPLPKGYEPPPNGLPIFPVYYRNDDESSQRLGTDSQLSFTPPEDGRYVVRVEDARGHGSDGHTYILKVRPRRPSFAAEVRGVTDKPFVAGTGREWEVWLTREDGFAGEVNVSLDNLPAGFSAPETITVEPDQKVARFSVVADADAKTAAEDVAKAVTLTATGETEDGRTVRREVPVTCEFKISEETPKATFVIDAPVVDGHPTVDIRPGETVSLVVRSDRAELGYVIEFGKEDSGRNLPWGVYVDNIGLNGLMLMEQETEREFFITASPVAVPQERWFHLRATNIQDGVTTKAVRVRVLPADQTVAGTSND